jgi:hypothetical protein
MVGTVRVDEAARKADAAVAAVRDDPNARFALAKQFYADQNELHFPNNYARSPLKFMHWELVRGVLRPPDDDPPGSPWWRAVNEKLLRDCLEADLLKQGVPGDPSTPTVAAWVAFLGAPSPVSWYRAHNGSIVAGYIAAQQLALAEERSEHLLMNLILARVLFAQALVSAPKMALGHLAFMARVMGDPRHMLVEVAVGIPALYPRHYPLLHKEKHCDEGRGEEIEEEAVRIVDEGVISPRLEALYHFAGEQLDEPRVLQYINDGMPCYPSPLTGHTPFHQPGFPHLMAKLAQLLTS